MLTACSPDRTSSIEQPVIVERRVHEGESNKNKKREVEKKSENWWACSVHSVPRGRCTFSKVSGTQVAKILTRRRDPWQTFLIRDARISLPVTFSTGISRIVRSSFIVFNLFDYSSPNQLGRFIYLDKRLLFPLIFIFLFNSIFFSSFIFTTRVS